MNPLQGVPGGGQVERQRAQVHLRRLRRPAGAGERQERAHRRQDELRRFGGVHVRRGGFF